MGCILSAASCNKWWIETILQTKDFQTEELPVTREQLGENDVCFLPYLMGERSPHNDPAARGAFVDVYKRQDKEGNALTLIDVISCDDTIVDDLDLKIKAEQLHEYLNQVLDEREKEIILLRYGIGGGNAMTQRVVAKKLGISRSYVSRIEKKALEKLKRRFDSAAASARRCGQQKKDVYKRQIIGLTSFLPTESICRSSTRLR